MDKRIGALMLGAVVAFGLGWGLARSGGPVDQTGRTLDGFGNDPETRFLGILQVDSPRERTALLLRFFEETDPEFAGLLQPLMLNPEPGIHVDEVSELLFADWWAGRDPAAAFATPINPRWPNRHPWMRQVMREWGLQDPVTAGNAVMGMSEFPSVGRLEAARAVVDAWLTHDPMPEPNRMLRLIGVLEPIPRSGALMHMVSTLVERRGLDWTLEFVRGISPDDDFDAEVRSELLARVGVVLIDYDIELAKAWAAEFRDTIHGPGIHKHLAFYWARKDGPAAMEWATQLPAGSGRAIVIKRAWLAFSRKRNPAARDWILSRAPTAEMQYIYHDFLRRHAETNPEEAMALANRTEDPELRARMQAAAAEGWLKNDALAASAWLASSGLSPELQRQARTGRRAPSSGPNS